jgi:chemotaxis protein histidine kinase CheA
MDKAAFSDVEADPKWWLLQPDVAFELTELRKDVSENIGWGREDQWYLEKWKVEELFDLIEQRSYLLLQELDDAGDDYKRQEWMTKVVELTKPVADEPAVKSGEGPAASAEAPATAAGSAPAAATAGETEIAPAAAAAAPKPSIFKKKAQPAPDAPAAEPAATAEAPAATADVEALEAAVKDVMAHIAPDNLPALASELGISEQELAELVRDLPENFETLIAAEVAKLTGSGRSTQ